MSAAFAGPEGIWSYDIKNTAYMVVVAWSVPFDDNLYEEKFNVKVTTWGRKLEYVVAMSQEGQWFSQVFVCPQGEGVCLHGGLLRGLGKILPELENRAVRILLECFLVDL